MLKKILVAVSAGIIIAALLVPAIAGSASVSLSDVAVQKTEAQVASPPVKAPVR